MGLKASNSNKLRTLRTNFPEIFPEMFITANFLESLEREYVKLRIAHTTLSNIYDGTLGKNS